MRILYLQDNGVVAIIHPSTSINPATGNPYTVEEVAVKDVPKGKKYKIVDAVIPAGSISIHSSRTYHSSVENNSGSDRIGMVVHFATDMAKRVNISGEHSKYLDMLDDQSICPIIYDS